MRWRRRGSRAGRWRRGSRELVKRRVDAAQKGLALLDSTPVVELALHLLALQALGLELLLKTKHIKWQMW